MIGIAALIVAGYAGYAVWPWWVAAIAGAAAGIWHFGVRAGAMPHLMDRTPQASGMLLQGTAVAIAIFGGLALAVYFIVRVITG
jgi:hypothetical protein